MDSEPLLDGNGDGDVDGVARGLAESGDQLYSPLEQRLRPFFYRLVHDMSCCSDTAKLVELTPSPQPSTHRSPGSWTCHDRWTKRKSSGTVASQMA